MATLRSTTPATTMLAFTIAWTIAQAMGAWSENPRLLL
jgi:hypothetical protein